MDPSSHTEKRGDTGARIARRPHGTTARALGTDALLAVVALALIGVCYGLARFAFGLFLPTFRETFDLTSRAAGLIASSSYLAYCAGIIGAVALSPRFGSRTVALAAGVLATSGITLVATAISPAMLLGGVAIAGASTGVASPPLAQAIARCVAPARRDRVQSIANAGTGAGVMLSGPVALLGQDHWRLSWGLFALAAFAVCVAVAVVVPQVRIVPTGARRGGPGAGRGRDGAERGERGSRTRVAGGPGPADARTTSTLALARLMGAAAVMGAASAMVWTFGQDRIAGADGAGPQVGVTAWIVLGACGLGGAAAGDLVRRLGTRAAWALLMGLLALSTVVLGIAPDSPSAAIAACAAFGAAYVALTGLVLVWATRIRPERTAVVVGVGFLAIALGQTLATPFWGAVADRAGAEAAFLGAGVLALAGAVLAPVGRRVRAHSRSGSEAAGG